MSVLVTGANGRIGRHVTERLLAGGRAVRALVLPGDPRRPLIERPGVDFVEGSLADEASLREAVDGTDAVIHLAAALTTRNHVDDEYFDATGSCSNSAADAPDHEVRRGDSLMRQLVE